MLRLGAIRRSCSLWASAIVLVRKKNGKLRFCIDLRKLNSKTLKASYALPRIEQTLESLADSMVYSTLDLTSGYWQVEMAEECKPYTAFTCGPLLFFECETMPFGATNAPATFQRLMEDCLGDLNMNWCIVYLDDVIVFSKTPDEYLERLEAVFQKLSAAGFKLKPSKCTFFKTKITYLGHLITSEGVATDPKKVEAVLKWPRPQTIHDVRSFLGFVGYYRRFIKCFSALSRPLYDLTKGLESHSKKIAKRTYVEWGEKEEQAFLALKEACTSAPVLGYPSLPKKRCKKSHRPRSAPSAMRLSAHKRMSSPESTAFEGDNLNTVSAIPTTSTDSGTLAGVPSVDEQLPDLVLPQPESVQENKLPGNAGNTEEELEAASTLLSLGDTLEDTLDEEEDNALLMPIGGANLREDVAPQPLRLDQVNVDNVITGLVKTEQLEKDLVDNKTTTEGNVSADLLPNKQDQMDVNSGKKGMLETKIYVLKKKSDNK